MLRAERRDAPRLGIARLVFESRPIDGAPIDSGRRSGLQPPLPQTDVPDLPGQRTRSSLTAPAARDGTVANEHSGIQECAGRYNHGATRQRARAGLETDDSPPADNKSHCLCDDDLHAAPVQQLSDSAAIESAVGLNPRTPDRRTLAAVEHAAVNRRPVGRARHQAVEHIELPDQMPLADAADRRVAGHLAGVFGTEGQQADTGATARGGRRRFTTGVAGANHEHIEHLGSLNA